jgi:hypothetical protein
VSCLHGDSCSLERVAAREILGELQSLRQRDEAVLLENSHDSPEVVFEWRRNQAAEVSQVPSPYARPAGVARQVQITRYSLPVTVIRLSRLDHNNGTTTR